MCINQLRAAVHICAIFAFSIYEGMHAICRNVDRPVTLSRSLCAPNRLYIGDKIQMIKIINISLSIFGVNF